MSVGLSEAQPNKKIYIYIYNYEVYPVDKLILFD